jgi:FdhE protein
VESSLRTRIAALADGDPALADDLAVRGAVISILDGASLDPPPLVLPGARIRAKLQRGIPLLDGESVVVPAAAAATFERLGVAWLADPDTRDASETVLTAVRGHRLHPEQAVGEGLAGHVDHLGQLADAASISPPLLATLADLAARPLLVGLATRLRPGLALGAWERGYCPICGAWPLLAERGHDATNLRCGRCLTSWAWPLPGCPYCSKGRLAPFEGAGTAEQGGWTVEGCDVCETYLKIADGERGDSLAGLLLDDLETWPLDRAAVGRGLGRPDGVGYRLELLDEDDEVLDDD